jgi:3-phosphoshikimate 1-carboxyvinyltransferase
VAAGTSSQFTSALLLYASQLHGPPIELELALGPDATPASAPYVEMTRAILRQSGIATERRGSTIVVHPAAPALARIPIEIDASSMSYFLALGALTGTTVEIPGIDQGSAQGDVGFAQVLADMGCEVAWSATGVRLQGRPLRGIDVDLRSMPDVALTLAALAPLARGPTRIRGVAGLRHKESDRIAAAVAALTRLGQGVEAGADELLVRPAGRLQPARIETHGDHRVAMAFAGLGLLQPGIEVLDPDCVGKSFPGFWAEFDRFCAHHRGGVGPAR